MPPGIPAGAPTRASGPVETCTRPKYSSKCHQLRKFREAAHTTLEIHRLWGASVAERLACSPPTNAKRIQSPARSLPDFRMPESRRTMPLVGGPSRDIPFPPSLHSGAAPYSSQSSSSALMTSMSRTCSLHREQPLVGGTSRRRTSVPSSALHRGGRGAPTRDQGSDAQGREVARGPPTSRAALRGSRVRAPPRPFFPLAGPVAWGRHAPPLYVICIISVVTCTECALQLRPASSCPDKRVNLRLLTWCTPGPGPKGPIYRVYENYYNKPRGGDSWDQNKQKCCYERMSYNVLLFSCRAYIGHITGDARSVRHGQCYAGVKAPVIDIVA
ncbi:hypothetical protein PR048_022048 [Dryococelus australis]|uniref:Uncharacterized protein n=1 Tax=Dryococelus australis TaxID=614101 RepID=A0ABQ9GZY0_9NEOP|nr:hypothetical protein PR048_022048 [Dryococelus australis]